MSGDQLKPKIPSGETRRLFGIVLLVLGLLMLFGGRPLETIGGALINMGSVLIIWGSVLGWLRVLEDRQIIIQETVAEMERADLQRDLLR